MEIVIAFLLLIGVITLGSNVSTSSEMEAHEPVAAQPEQTATEPGTGNRQRPCRFADGPLIQRDLTVPPASAVPSPGKTIDVPGHAGCHD